MNKWLQHCIVFLFEAMIIGPPVFCSSGFKVIACQQVRICIIGTSVSKPHTSELNCNFSYIIGASLQQLECVKNRFPLCL